MRIQRNNPQSKGKEGSPGKELFKFEANNLSDIDFKTMIIGMLNELNENYKGLYGKYKKHSGNYSSMQKDIEAMNRSQEEMKNTISEMKNTLEGIKSRLDEAED